MKKRVLTLVIVVIVLGLLIGAYFIIGNLQKEDDTASEDTTQTITVISSSPDNATALSYASKNGKASFTLDGTWVYDGDKEFPLSQTKFQDMLDSATKVEAKRDITEEAQTDDSVYGFDAPTLTLTVSYNDSTKDELVFGMYNDTLSSYYLKYRDKIYLTGSDTVDAFDKELYDLLDTTNLETISEDSVKSYTKNQTVITSDSDSERFEALKSAYTSLSVGDVADYKNPEKYGFDGTQTKITVEYTETSEVTAEDGSTSTSADVTHQYFFELASKDGKTYIRLPDDDLIYNVTGADEFLK